MRRFAALVITAAVAAACGDASSPVVPIGAEAALAKQARVVVCHAEGNGGYHAIEVAAAALPAHAAHGDGSPGSALADHSGSFTSDCARERIVLVANDVFNTGLGGGGGGAPFDDPCAAGSVAVGLSGDQVNYFGHAALFRHRIECRELRGDGTLGASSSTPDRGLLFNIPPQNPYTGICTSDGILIGANGDNHSLVNSITGSCAGVGTILAGGGATSTVGPFSGFGFGFFATYNLPCPANYAVTATVGSAGDVLDSVGFRCTRVIRESF